MYKALYRQYRPKTFDDLVGQEAIATTLKNAIDQNKVAHAYLFAGPRGTGKTSVAKIFARAINDVQVDDAEQEFADIIEIDAASNNGVDDTRKLIESANYAPIELPFKVYIIDEVHMMSTSAFNALLKTIEEPPAQVKFILATTDPQKIPATILSRVQRFDFKRIPQEQIVQRMKFVLEDIGATYQDDALETIAKIAEGGMRDALSILDQVYSISTDNNVTNDVVLEITGRTNASTQADILVNAVNGQTSKALELLSHELNDGKDSRALLNDLVGLIKDAMLYGVDQSLIANNLDAVKIVAENVDVLNLSTAVTKISDTLDAMRGSDNPDTFAEILMINLANSSDKDIQVQTVPKNPGVQPQVQQIQYSEIKPAVQEVTPVASQMSQGEEHAQIESPMVIEEETDLQVQPAPEEVQNGADSPIETTTQVQEQVVETATPQITANYEFTTAFDGAEKIVELLSKADKEELISAKEAFEEIKESATDNYSDLVTSARIVAANPEYLTVSFELPQFLNLATKDPQFVNQIGDDFLEVMGSQYKFILVEDTQWEEIKKAFVDRKKGIDHPLNFSKQVPVNQPTNPSSEDEFVQEAKAMFGDIVKVKNS